jgi:hypothetical protein
LAETSLTNHFVIAEGYIVNWLFTDIEPNLDPNQYGNRPGRSTSHYLVHLVNTLYSHAETPGSISTVVITDYSKAFDRVDHNIVIQKLLRLGARPCIIPWFCSFLSDRVQWVRYSGILSAYKPLKAGVPQGTKFGPVGFLGMGNDAAVSHNIVTLKYVDDMTLIERSNRKCNSNNMQHELNDLEQWANCNHMQLNPAKCMVMYVSFIRDTHLMNPLMLCNEPLQETDSVKILGLHLSSDLKWDLQVNEILKRANGRLYMLKVLRKFGLSLANLITVYVGYIRPLAEYAAPVWHPGLTEKQSVSLERIQKRACTIMLGGRYTDYENALLMCNIPSLKDRRIELCLTFANSLLCSDEFRNWLPPTRGVLHNRALRNAHKLTTPRWTTKRYLQSPIPYYVQLLNGKM